MADSSEDEIGEKQEVEIAEWFLANAPAGEIQYVAKDVRSILGDGEIYEMAAAEAFPAYNKADFLALEMPNRGSDVCTKVRPATDDELPSSYIEDFRGALDVELCEYVGEAYTKGTCSVYYTKGKDVEGPGADLSSWS